MLADEVFDLGFCLKEHLLFDISNFDFFLHEWSRVHPKTLLIDYYLGILFALCDSDASEVSFVHIFSISHYVLCLVVESLFNVICIRQAIRNSGPLWGELVLLLVTTTTTL